MDSEHYWLRQQGDWTLEFHAPSSLLQCTHNLSGAQVQGTLRFEATLKEQHEAWRIGLPRDGVCERLALLDLQGNVQGYLAFSGANGTLRILALHRAAQAFCGTLSFTGTATLGKSTFACRTRCVPGTQVVQMASGPADSHLNDSLFDAEKDTLLRFRAASVVLTTEEGEAGQTPRFRFQITAHPEDASRAELTLELEKDYYRSRYVPFYRPLNRQRCPSPPTGWMSWNVYFDTAGEKENLEEARIGAQHLKPFGLQIWSIESWQAGSDHQPVRNFDNLSLRCHEGQFPHGMKWLADQIRALGFRPGIWTVPFGTGSREFYEAHRSWFLHDDTGAPLRNWSGHYVLDPSQPAVRRHMEEMHRVMAQEWGYEFFKIDGMSGRGPSYSAHFFERDEVRKAFANPCPNPFEECVRSCRAGIGEESLFLACQGHYTGPEVAYADAARIGGDIVSPNQPPKWHNLLSQAASTLNQLFVHNLVWYNDPDTLLVGDFHTLDAARVATTIVALPGQVMFAGDRLAELSQERMRLLQQSLPVCEVHPLDLFPIFDLKPIWDLKIRRPFATWDVVSLFNWGESETTLGFHFSELGLPEDAVYLVYEFWSQRFLGRYTAQFHAVVPPRSNLLLAIHRDLGRPQFLSTDRHITQGGTCLQHLHWDSQHGVLSGTTHFVAQFPVRLVFYVPSDYQFTSAEADGASLLDVSLQGDSVLTFVLESNRTGLADWRVFTRRKTQQ